MEVDEAAAAAVGGITSEDRLLHTFVVASVSLACFGFGLVAGRQTEGMERLRLFQHLLADSRAPRQRHGGLL